MRFRSIIVGVALVLAATPAAQVQAAPGDLNCDGAKNGLDVGPFVLAVLDPWAYQEAYPNCPWSNADLDCDGDVDADDIGYFVDCLLSGNCSHCPQANMVLISAGEFQMGDAFAEAATIVLPRKYGGPAGLECQPIGLSFHV